MEITVSLYGSFRNNLRALTVNAFMNNIEFGLIVLFVLMVKLKLIYERISIQSILVELISICDVASLER